MDESIANLQLHLVQIRKINLESKADELVAAGLIYIDAFIAKNKSDFT